MNVCVCLCVCVCVCVSARVYVCARAHARVHVLWGREGLTQLHCQRQAKFRHVQHHIQCRLHCVSDTFPVSFGRGKRNLLTLLTEHSCVSLTAFQHKTFGSSSIHPNVCEYYEAHIILTYPQIEISERPILLTNTDAGVET